jgi:hypothetical protein
LASLSPHYRKGEAVEIKLLKTFFPVLCLALCLGISGCGSGSSASPRPLDPPAFGQDYKFADNEINGWTQDPASDAFWAGTDLIAGTSIDGAADAYTSQGFRQGMFQNLDGSNSQTCTIRAMDFGTADKATAMYEWAQANFVSQATAIPTYPSSIATGNAAQSGLSVYAHFGATYFEVLLSGLGDQTATCAECAVAQPFLDKLKQKTN